MRPVTGHAKIIMAASFILVLSLPAMASEETAPAHKQWNINTSELRLLLNSFAALGEGHIEHVLRGLKLMSVTEEVQSGKWEDMRRVLAEFRRSSIKAAALWFARPDGSYYTVDKGLTGLNLRDRNYFPRLMAGGEITGELVINKSTGRRTAIVAVPIRKDEKIIGALGASLAVEDISRMLDEQMGLPENMIFFALDQKGHTSIHRVSTMLFAYPSDMGSKSLSKTVAEMLSQPEGVVTYDFYGERSVVFKKFPLTGWVFAIGVVTGRPGRPGAELPPVLSELGKEITTELNKMDRDLARLAKSLSGKYLKTAGTRKMLNDLCRSYSYAVDCAAVDRSGKMVLVVPEEYAEFEGSDISDQEQVVRLWQTKKAVLSSVIRTVEGIDAVDLEHPVFSPGGELAGSVSLLFSPETMLAAIISPVVQGMPVDAWLMQKDGRILYDTNEEEVGRILFNDPMYKLYPQLLALGTFIAREKSGSGSYEFLGKGLEKPVRKDASWTTVGLHGTEWRLVLTHVRTGHALDSGKDIEKPAAVPQDEALRTLAENAEMKEALSWNNHARILDMFRDFYSEHEGIYSIQWLDSRGINLLGYPEENSLINFDMKTLKTPSSRPILQALSDKKESSFESPLLEGKTGIFFMVPVFGGGEYLGMIYTIRIRE